MSAVLMNPPAPEFALADLTVEMNTITGDDHGSNGRVARTVIELRGLRVLLVSMKSGRRWDQHLTAGRVTVQPVRGKIRLRWRNEEATLAPGQLAALAAKVPHDVIAEIDSVFLLTVARPQLD